MARRETRAQRRERIHQAALRRREAARDDPARITAPLTPRTLDRELRGAERSRFSDVDRQIRGEYGQAAHMQRQIPQWFQQYRADIQAAEERTRAGFAQAAQQFQQFTQQNEAGAAQQQQGIQAQEQASAAQRGATVDPALAQVAQQAAASRHASAASQSGLIGTLGANAGAHLANRGVAAGGQQIVAQQDEVRRKGAIDERARGVAREKGDFRVAYRQQARDKERTYGLERQAFGLNVAKAEQDAADDRSDNRRQRSAERRQQMERDRQYQLDREKFGEAQAKDRYQREHGLGPYKPAAGEKGKKGRKPTARDFKGRDAILAARRQYDRFGGDADKYRRSAARNNVSPVVAEAGRQFATQGYIGPNTARRLRDIGIRVPRSWTKQPRAQAFPNRPPELR